MAYKVAVDAGHGSQTAGKRTPDGYREHTINVKCAYYFDIAMKRCGIQTLRVAWNDTNSTDDPDVSLTTRQNQIRNAKCDISVSWHANAYGNGTTYNSAQGIETLIHSNVARVKDSYNLAVKVQNQLIKGTSQKNRGVKSANLAMCNCATMGTRASILIEVGFMTNSYEANLMKTDAFCKECAEEAAKGVCEYLDVVYIKEGNTVRYKTHVQGIGWMNEVENGKTSGTVGQSRRMEAIVIDGDAKFTYQVHCQNKGDMSPVTNGKIAGTTGQSLRMEAIKIECNKPIKYRVHVQGIGWMNWVNNGSWAGTRGQARRMEAIEIKFV